MVELLFANHNQSDFILQTYSVRSRLGRKPRPGGGTDWATAGMGRSKNVLSANVENLMTASSDYSVMRATGIPSWRAFRYKLGR